MVCLGTPPDAPPEGGYRGGQGASTGRSPEGDVAVGKVLPPDAPPRGMSRRARSSPGRSPEGDVAGGISGT